jgi:hypothetical protein
MKQNTHQIFKLKNVSKCSSAISRVTYDVPCMTHVPRVGIPCTCYVYETEDATKNRNFVLLGVIVWTTMLKFILGKLVVG